MFAGFSVMDQHLDAPRAAFPHGKVVLSRLRPGQSVIGAAAPSLKLVLDGEEIYRVDGRDIRIRPGEFLYLDAGTDCIGTNRTETTGMCLMLPPSARLGGDEPLAGRAFALSTGTSNLGRSLMDYAARIARDPAKGDLLASEIVGRVGHALVEPLGASRAAIEGLKAAKPSTRRDLYQRLDRARAHLHDHLDRGVPLGELASIARLSQFHLARYFKLAFGEAPIAYHRALRLSRAAEFLSAGEGSVAQAAELVGYSDAVALSHAFRKHFGQPPQRYAQSYAMRGRD